MSRKRRVLVVSGVHPVARKSGQQVRVYNTLLALRERFAVDFLTIAAPDDQARVRRELAEVVDEPVVLPSVTQRNLAVRLAHKVSGLAYAAGTGLKASNYVLGLAELTPSRVAAACDPAAYDLVLFEYWHTYRVTALFHAHGVPTVLDLHDVLWRAYEEQLAHKGWMPAAMRRRRVAAYRIREETAWRCYDGLIAISAGEADYVRQRVPDREVFLTPMGIDLSRFPYSWKPASPPRLAFYGSLGSPQNIRSALRCISNVMPAVWQRRPDVELWLVGANPPEVIRSMARDGRIHVTGFVEDLREVLGPATAVLCPWDGTYGFRSRLIEVMALGVPVVATPDAVHGMGLSVEDGLLLAPDDGGIAELALTLLSDAGKVADQSRRARRQVEEKFSFDATYARLAGKLCKAASLTERRFSG